MNGLGSIIWVAVIVGFFFLMMRKGGCCGGGHGRANGENGKGAPDGHDRGAEKGDVERAKKGGCH